MAIKRNHFHKEFLSFPPWRCPTCRQGTLSSIEGKQAIVETGPSEKAHSHEAWDPDWITERFVDLLKCSHRQCEQIIGISGRTRISLDYYYGPDGQTEADTNRYFQPIGFDPAPMIIELPSNLPDSIEEPLLAAFQLYWCDKNACANKLRAAVECLMDEVKIPAVKKGKDQKKRPVTLHNRLVQYSSINKEASDFLLAVKWIGNTGSHSARDSLDSEDLLDVLELLEWVLDEAFSGKRKRLQKIADAINSAKGKPTTPSQTT